MIAHLFSIYYFLQELNLVQFLVMAFIMCKVQQINNQ